MAYQMAALRMFFSDIQDYLALQLFASLLFVTPNRRFKSVHFLPS